MTNWGELIGAASQIGWTEEQFWRSSFYGLSAAISARFAEDDAGSSGMTPARIDELMKAYPDAG